MGVVQIFYFFKMQLMLLNGDPFIGCKEVLVKAPKKLLRPPFFCLPKYEVQRTNSSFPFFTLHFCDSSAMSPNRFLTIEDLPLFFYTNFTFSAPLVILKKWFVHSVKLNSSVYNITRGNNSWLFANHEYYSFANSHSQLAGSKKVYDRMADT